MNILEYAGHYIRNIGDDADAACTERQIRNVPKRFDECSIRKADFEGQRAKGLKQCWVSEAASGTPEYTPSNKLCDRTYESCATWRHEEMVEGAVGIDCVLTAYCGKTAADGLVFGEERIPVDGTIECKDGKKVDTSKNQGKTENERKAEKQEAAAAAKTVMVAPGKVCKTKGNKISTPEVKAVTGVTA